MKKNTFEYVWTDKKRSFLGLPLTFTRYYLTESKFITRTGFLNIDEDEIDLYKITDKKVKYPFFQRLVNCGTIIIYSRDADTPSKEVHCIKNVRKVSELIDKYLNIMRDKYGIRGRDMMSMHAHDHCDDSDDVNDHDGDY
ncbi:PH domain-containing protein [Ruminococcus flavefaciens]|uniref:PH domain-containing protein n=1 Tax=Ruminococcus flavefaciens TaxID=1265 RepID=A0A1H6L332_RUMFL|nr:PH domain-containing protein [Ruminococcus flavefaciens]SEH82594.1 PH domain-containing protein [Ruminococcus flavefaciens]